VASFVTGCAVTPGAADQTGSEGEALCSASSRGFNLFDPFEKQLSDMGCTTPVYTGTTANGNVYMNSLCPGTFQGVCGAHPIKDCSTNPALDALVNANVNTAPYYAQEQNHYYDANCAMTKFLPPGWLAVDWDPGCPGCGYNYY
jgi:hypothetical protein